MTSRPVDGSGYKPGKLLSPATLGGVVVVHLVLGAAVLSMTAIQIIRDNPGILWVDFQPAPKDKPVDPPPPPKARSEVKPDTVTRVAPKIEMPGYDPTPFVMPEIKPFAGGTGDGIVPTKLPPVIDPPPPVMVQPRLDPRYSDAVQPPYPAAMLRVQMEGAVTVRVLIGEDGRVRDVLLVSAADPAFFEATKRQALRYWRFLPATQGGVAVPSEKVLTVHFRLTE